MVVRQWMNFCKTRDLLSTVFLLTYLKDESILKYTTVHCVGQRLENIQKFWSMQSSLMGDKSIQVHVIMMNSEEYEKKLWCNKNYTSRSAKGHHLCSLTVFSSRRSLSRVRFQTKISFSIRGRGSHYANTPRMTALNSSIAPI